MKNSTRKVSLKAKIIGLVLIFFTILMFFIINAIVPINKKAAVRMAENQSDFEVKNILAGNVERINTWVRESERSLRLFFKISKCKESIKKFK